MKYLRITLVGRLRDKIAILLLWTMGIILRHFVLVNPCLLLEGVSSLVPIQFGLHLCSLIHACKNVFIYIVLHEGVYGSFVDRVVGEDNVGVFDNEVVAWAQVKL